MALLRTDIRTSFRADGAALMDPKSGNLYTLNASGALIAQCLRDGQSAAETADVLVSRFELTHERALACVENFIAKISEAGLLKD